MITVTLKLRGGWILSTFFEPSKKCGWDVMDTTNLQRCERWHLLAEPTQIATAKNMSKQRTCLKICVPMSPKLDGFSVYPLRLLGHTPFSKRHMLNRNHPAAICKHQRKHSGLFRERNLHKWSETQLGLLDRSTYLTYTPRQCAMKCLSLNHQTTMMSKKYLKVVSTSWYPMISPIFDYLKSKFELGVYRSIHFQKHPSLVCRSHPHVIPIVGKKSPWICPV